MNVNKQFHTISLIIAEFVEMLVYVHCISVINSRTKLTISGLLQFFCFEKVSRSLYLSVKKMKKTLFISE